MIHWLIGLAISASQLPPSLAEELAQLNISGKIESIVYAPNNRLQLGYQESVRVVYSPVQQRQYEQVHVVECKVTASEESKWVCDDQLQWRINSSSQIYVHGNVSVNRWIAKDPEKALAPYLSLIGEANAIYPTDSHKQPLMAISISDDGANAIYASYGSGCRTTIQIRPSFSKEGTSMHLDLLNERTVCI